MNLDKLSIAIRPRRDWEAVDLGILMARHWYTLSLKIWLIITAPLFILAAFTPSTISDWTIFVAWLLKPLFERPLLMILSQGVFGDTPSLNTVLKATPKLFSIQILPSITWRRLSGTRSMDLPVIQLEGLKGKERQARLGILHRQDSKPANWLTIIGIHLESFLFFSMMAFIFALIPEQLEFSFFEFDFWASQGGQILTAVLGYLSMALIAPFYVACGFSLYLNRRIKLEGWDLEIAFKRIVKRRRLNQYAAAILLIAAGFFALAPQPALAEDENNILQEQLESAPTAEDQQELTEREFFRQEMVQIVSEPPFRNTKTIKVKKEEEPKDLSDINFGFLGDIIAALARFLNASAAFLEIILWVAVAILIVFVASKFKRWQQFFAERGFFQRDEFKPKTLFGMEVTEESLPQDVSAAAMDFWQKGDHRAALALLYRASLTRLLINGLPLKDGNTEQECLRLVATEAQQHEIPSTVINYFTQLTKFWRQLAYGHIQPPADQAQQLCKNWNQCWLGDASEA